MSDNDRVIFTSSYNKNKQGLYTSHVVDVIPEDKWAYTLSNFSYWNAMAVGYTNILNPGNANLQYWFNTLTTKEFKENHTNTGRRKYKIKP